MTGLGLGFWLGLGLWSVAVSKLPGLIDHRVMKMLDVDATSPAPSTRSLYGCSTVVLYIFHAQTV